MEQVNSLFAEIRIKPWLYGIECVNDIKAVLLGFIIGQREQVGNIEWNEYFNLHEFNNFVQCYLFYRNHDSFWALISKIQADDRNGLGLFFEIFDQFYLYKKKDLEIRGLMCHRNMSFFKLNQDQADQNIEKIRQIKELLKIELPLLYTEFIVNFNVSANEILQIFPFYAHKKFDIIDYSNFLITKMYNLDEALEILVNNKNLFETTPFLIPVGEINNGEVVVYLNLENKSEKMQFYRVLDKFVYNYEMPFKEFIDRLRIFDGGSTIAKYRFFSCNNHMTLNSTIKDFENKLDVCFPEGYKRFLSIFNSMTCMPRFFTPFDIPELDFYFGKKVFIEEFYSLEKMQEIYLEYKFLDLDLIHHSKILIIGEFFGGHEFIGIGFGENNYNNMFWIESSEWPDLGDKDNWDFNTMSKYWYDFGITFEEFMTSIECEKTE